MPDKWTYIDLDWDMDLQICKAIFQSIPSPLPHSTPMRSNLIPDPGQQNKPNQVESGVQMWMPACTLAISSKKQKKNQPKKKPNKNSNKARQAAATPHTKYKSGLTHRAKMCFLSRVNDPESKSTKSSTSSSSSLPGWLLLPLDSASNHHSPLRAPAILA